MKVIILAGGKGTRLHTSAKDMPKALVPVAGKPILQHQLDLLGTYEFNDIRLSLGFKAEQIIEYLRGRYEYRIESEPLGTGGALKFASADLQEPFMAMNGDIIADINLSAFARSYTKGMNCLAISFCRQNTDFGFLKIGRNGAIKQFLEKPRKPKNGFVSVGFYILEPDAVRSIPQKAFSLEYDLFPRLAEQKKLASFEHKGFWIDVGTEKRLHFMRVAPENEKITLFTVPRSFVGKDAISQQNAIASWSRLSENVEILLLGNAHGVKEYAASCSAAVKHIPEISVNKFGTALLGDVFKKATDAASYKMIAFVQSDIILTANFITSVRNLPRRSPFLAVARQTDIAIDKPIDFNAGWEEWLEEQVKLRGAPRGLSAMNVMIFPKNMHIPRSNLLIGKPGWDNAFAYQMMKQGAPMIDASLAFTPISQKHKESRIMEESKHNFELAGGFSQMVSIRNAHILFTPHGLLKPPFIKRMASFLLFSKPIRKLIGIKRWLYNTAKL